MKRRGIISIILVLAMIISLFPSAGVFAAGDGKTVVTVESVSAIPGDTFDVKVDLKNNPGIIGAVFKVSYDTGLELVDAKSGGAFEKLSMTKPGVFTSPCQFMWDALELSESDVKDGNILILTFKMSENASAGSELNISLTYSDGDIIDTDLKSVPIDVVDGKVSVVDFTPGDVNNDSKVNSTDVVLIRRFIAGGYGVSINEDAGDVNADSRVNTTDVILVRRFIAGGYKDTNGNPLALVPGKISNKCDHTLTATAYKAPTCTESGNIGYWHCNKCDKYFSDKNGITEIAAASVEIAASGHTVVTDPAVPATYESTGLTEGAHCSVCNTVLKEQEIIPKLQKNQYSIVYHVDSNDSYLKQQTINNPNPDYYTSEDGLKLKNVSVNGYKFLGWFDGESDNAVQIKEITAGTKDNIELYAHWELVNYKVQFDCGTAPIVEVSSKSYTVDSGCTLPNPTWYGYTFLGWIDDYGNVVSRINPGFSGNTTLHAVWTSKRNQTVPVTKLDDPMIFEDEEDGVYLFTYEIGRMENVPLYTIREFGNQAGIEITETITSSGSISSQSSESITKTLSEATTDSRTWALSEDWNDIITINEEHIKELNSSTNKTSTVGFSNSINDKYSDEAGGKSASSLTTKTGVSGKGYIELGASLNATASIDIFDIGGGYTGKVGFEAESFKNTDKTKSMEKTWNSSESHEASSNVTSSSSVSSSLSEMICDKYGYGQSYSKGGSQSESRTTMSSKAEEDKFATQIVYSNATTETTAKTYSNTNAPEGYYRLVCAGTMHVFAVVGYDIATGDYFVSTYSVMDDETHDFIDYSKNTPNFDDHNNGVLPFEIPIFVNDYIDEKTAATEGLIVDVDTGKIVEFSNDYDLVVVPRYISVDNGDGTKSAIKVTGFESQAFAGKQNLKAIVFDENVKEIPDNAFEGCVSLEKVVCPGVEKIGNNAFKGCSSLTDYVVDSKVKEMGKTAFDSADCLTVNAANTQVAEAAIASGAKNIIINMDYSEDALAEGTYNIPSSTEYFEFNGGGKEYNNVQFVSDAGTTIINNATFNDDAGVPLKISSENVTLNRVTVNAPKLGLIMTSDNTNLALYGTVSINSSSADAVLCKNTSLSWANTSVAGKLSSNANVLVCGDILNQNYLSIAEGSSLIKISQEEFDIMLDESLLDSLPWVLESEVPTSAHILAEKWTYDETEEITSDVDTVEGYTLYDSSYVWGQYGSWSAWSNTKVNGSDSRKVETRNIAATYKTQYNYSKWSQYNSATSGGWSGPSEGYWGGVYCGNYLERGWSDSRLALYSWSDSTPLYGASGNTWYNETSRQVQVTPAYTQYRYCDRQQIFTYYLRKTESKESNTEVIPTEGIGNIQKWVKYIEY